MNKTRIFNFIALVAAFILQYFNHLFCTTNVYSLDMYSIFSAIGALLLIFTIKN